MFASLASTPTRQQGAGENWKPSAQPVQKAENSCVFTTTETQRSKGFFFFFFFHRLPIPHLPFPSQPCGHKGSSISVNRIKCSIDPASHSILQDTLSTGLSKAPKPLNWAITARFIQDILPLSVRKILPSPVQTVQTTWGAGCYTYRGHLV